MNLRDGYQAVMEAAARAFEQPVKLLVSDWADQHRWVSQKSSPEPGPWRTSRTPYAAEPMNELSSLSRTQEVVIMAASQVLKTEVLLNWIFESIDQDPGPMLVVQPTEKAVKDFVSQRLDPAIELMPRIRSKVPAARKRDSGNRITEKNFPGGVLYLGWSNSASELASKPIKKLGLDEVDRYPISIKDEGSPIKLAEQRAANYPRRKILKASTPKIKGASVIEAEYESSSQAQYWVPCPHCGAMQVLEFKNLRWKKTVDADGKKVHWPHTAEYVCSVPDGCGQLIEERFKPDMLSRGEWRHRFPQRRKRGYHINGLYSPVGLGYSWGERAEKFLEAKDDPRKLQTFTNLHEGLPYEDHSDQLQASQMQQHAEHYPLRTILAGYLVLTLGVDVQRDRWAFHLVAWGRGERCHTVDYTEIPGDPARQEEWERVVTTYRRRPVRNAFGVDVRISMTGIDSSDGHHTNDVYRYCRKYRHDGVIALKGASQANKPVLGRPTKQDVRNERGELDRNGAELWPVGTDTCKGTIFARIDGDMLHDDPANRMVRFTSELPASFFEGIASEVFDPDTGKWKKRAGRRNEPLDTWNYAYAAAHYPTVAIHTARVADWEELERLLQPIMQDMFAPSGAVQTSGSEQTVASPPADAPAAEGDPAPAATVPSASPAQAADEGDPWVPEVPDNWI